MKKLLGLSVLAVLGAFAPAAAFATPQPVALAVPVLALPQVPAPPVTVSCADRLVDQIEKMQAPGMANNVSATSTIIAGEMAYAESCGTATAFCEGRGTASYSGADIVGTSKLGRPGSTDRSNLGFRITNVDGSAKLKWSFKGKSYTGTVKSCTNGYWTAASASSAVAIKLGRVGPVVQ